MGSRSRDMNCPSFTGELPALNLEGAGKTGCAPHPRSRVQFAHKERAHEHTGSAETLRPSLHNGFTAYTRSPRRTAFLPPSSAGYRAPSDRIDAQPPT